MKTYCKHLIVSDVEKIYKSITEYMHDKYKKNSSIRFYAGYTGNSKQYIRENLKPGSGFWREVNGKLAKSMAFHIKNKTMKQHIIENACGFPVIRYREIKDAGSGKERMLGLETVLFRLYEEVAKNAAAPMFKAKVGTYQVASIKGKGQSYGKRAIEHWLATDVEGTKFSDKADIKQCYPSVPHDKLQELLHRDLGKCDDLLYMFDTFIELYEEWPNPKSENKECGILIGSPVAKDLCNYYLSYAYHYVSERLVKRTCRRGREKIKRLVSHVMFYADDITLYGNNKKDLHIAMEKLMKFMKDFLGLVIKPDWVKQKTMYIDKEGKRRGNLLDYMGFRFHSGVVKVKEYYGRIVRHREVWTTIRDRIFLKARRKRAVFEKMIRRMERVGMKFVKSLTSHFGWYKNTDMVKYRKKRKVDKLLKIARKIVSDDDKGKGYDERKYYNMWRRYYA